MNAQFIGLTISAIIHLACGLLAVVPLFGLKTVPGLVPDPASTTPLSMMVSTFKEPAPEPEQAVEPVVKTKPVPIEKIKKLANPKKVVEAQPKRKSTPQKQKTVSQKIQNRQSKVSKTREFQEKHPTVQPVATGNPAIISMLWSRYKQTLRMAVQQHHRYPLQSRRRHEQGTVIIKFRVDKGGNISRIRVIASSGHLHLDKAATVAIQSTGRFQPFPSTISEVYREFELPVRFSL